MRAFARGFLKNYSARQTGTRQAAQARVASFLFVLPACHSLFLSHHDDDDVRSPDYEVAMEQQVGIINLFANEFLELVDQDHIDWVVEEVTTLILVGCQYLLNGQSLVHS